MCLYPRLIRNKKYTENSKNGGEIPLLKDVRTLYVPRACGNCMECRKQYARAWQVRLLEDIKTNKNGKFVTLTFSNESIAEITDEIRKENTSRKTGIPTGYHLDNTIATYATRHFLERWRKKTTKSVRHLLITELGHKGTENIHLHGIIWTNETFDLIHEKWKYGFTYPESEQERKNNYVNGETVNYIIKYITKQHELYKGYKAIILCSAGIGKNYLNGHDCKKNKFNGKNTIETYRTSTGHKISMPTYWRNKIYSDEEKEQLWINRLDKNERWIWGEKIDISKDEKDYYKTLKWYQNKNKILGYGSDKQDWKRAIYEGERRKMMNELRIQDAIMKKHREIKPEKIKIYKEKGLKRMPPAAPTGGGY